MGESPEVDIGIASQKNQIVGWLTLGCSKVCAQSKSLVIMRNICLNAFLFRFYSDLI